MYLSSFDEASGGLQMGFTSINFKILKLQRTIACVYNLGTRAATIIILYT